MILTFLITNISIYTYKRKRVFNIILKTLNLYLIDRLNKKRY